jgi:hypothetical protein
MIRFAALATLAALAACGPAPDGYVHGGGNTVYAPSYYDRPYWGPSYYDPPVYAHPYRGRPHAGPGYRGDRPGGQVNRGPQPGGPTPQSRQFWGVERPAMGPRGGGGAMFGGVRPNEPRNVEQGAD